jgi:hypothetical protein
MVQAAEHVRTGPILRLQRAAGLDAAVDDVVVIAQVDCEAIPAGPSRTNCYIGLSRVYRGQSDVAAGNARVQSDAARLQQVTGTRSRPKASKHRRTKTAAVGPK